MPFFYFFHEYLWTEARSKEEVVPSCLRQLLSTLPWVCPLIPWVLHNARESPFPHMLRSKSQCCNDDLHVLSMLRRGRPFLHVTWIRFHACLHPNMPTSTVSERCRTERLPTHQIRHHVHRDGAIQPRFHSHAVVPISRKKSTQALHQ